MIFNILTHRTKGFFPRLKFRFKISLQGSLQVFSTVILYLETDVTGISGICVPSMFRNLT